MKEVVIKSPYLAISPHKMNLVANLIRKKELIFSLKTLPFVQKKAARILFKILKGFEKNMSKNSDNIQDYYFKKIEVNKGPMPKKILYRAKGRSDIIRKNYCLVNLYITKKTENFEQRKPQRRLI